MNIINLTPHPITFMDCENDIIEIVEPSDKIARLKTDTAIIGWINDIPITKTVFGKVENLPDPKDNTVYILSSLVAKAVNDRDDVFIPNESVRDEKGRIIGCKSLGRI